MFLLGFSKTVTITPQILYISILNLYIPISSIWKANIWYIKTTHSSKNLRIPTEAEGVLQSSSLSDTLAHTHTVTQTQTHPHALMCRKVLYFILLISQGGFRVS